MAIAERGAYLRPIVELLLAQWPGNRTVNIVCHGHSVPAGYFATPMVDTFNAYPALLHRDLKHRFPFAVINVIVTAIGGEGSPQGADRFEADVLCHRPDVVTIDYGLNDRRAGLDGGRYRVAENDRGEPGAAGQGAVADPDLGQHRRGGSGRGKPGVIWRATPSRFAAWPPSTRWGWSTASPRSRSTWPRVATRPTCCRGATIPTATGTSWWRASCCAGSRFYKGPC